MLTQRERLVDLGHRDHAAGRHARRRTGLMRARSADAAACLGDGLLSVSDGDLITATYQRLAGRHAGRAGEVSLATPIIRTSAAAAGDGKVRSRESRPHARHAVHGLTPALSWAR